MSSEGDLKGVWVLCGIGNPTIRFEPFYSVLIGYYIDFVCVLWYIIYS